MAVDFLRLRSDATSEWFLVRTRMRSKDVLGTLILHAARPWSLPLSRRVCRNFCHCRLPAWASSSGLGKRCKNIQAETEVQSSKASNTAG